MPREPIRPVVFVGSSTPALKIARAVGQGLKDVANVSIWDRAFDNDSWLLGGILNKAKEADFAVFVIRRDDIVKIRNTEYYSVRDNVLFEAGVFMGALDINRTVLLWPVVSRGRRLRLPSDLEGFLRVPYVPATRGRNLRLAKALATIRNRIKSLGPALRSGYNEISALKQALLQQDIDYTDGTHQALGRIVQRAAARRNGPWFNTTSVQTLTSALLRDNDTTVVDTVYWWLIIHGVITFDNADEWTSGSWHWRNSVDYARLTERGVILLNEYRTASRGRR